MNWKTTLSGSIAAAALFVTSYPAHFNQLEIDLAKFIMIGGLAGIGIFAKDASTHSTAADVEKATVKAMDKAVPPGTVAVVQSEPPPPKDSLGG